MDSTLIIAVGVVVAVQIALQVTALVQLWRTPAERVSLGGRKWAWALIIVLTELIGPIAWFVAGKSAAPVEQDASGSASSTTSAVDSLYGSKG